MIYFALLVYNLFLLIGSIYCVNVMGWSLWTYFFAIILGLGFNAALRD